MTDKIGYFSPRVAQLIHDQVVNNNQNLLKLPPNDTKSPLRPRYALLSESLSTATNPLTGYKTAKAQLLRYKSNLSPETDDLDMEETFNANSEITVVNRSADTSASAGTLILVMRVGSEWAPVWVDCTAYSSASATPLMTAGFAMFGGGEIGDGAETAYSAEESESDFLTLSRDQASHILLFPNIAVKQGEIIFGAELSLVTNGLMGSDWGMLQVSASGIKAVSTHMVNPHAAGTEITISIREVIKEIINKPHWEEMGTVSLMVSLASGEGTQDVAFQIRTDSVYAPQLRIAV
jgi:hypothetical protein